MLCYLYLNCVLGYAHIYIYIYIYIYIRLTCYMYYRVPFYTRSTFRQKQTIQDIQPSTRPQINSSQVPAGRFLLFMLFLLFFEFVIVLLVFYIWFFDCKCKSLKRLGEYIKTKQKET